MIIKVIQKRFVKHMHIMLWCAVHTKSVIDEKHNSFRQSFYKAFYEVICRYSGNIQDQLGFNFLL